MGSYRNSPFVTGSDTGSGKLKTEILDYKAKKWTEVKDYPFTRERLIEKLIYSGNYCHYGLIYISICIHLTHHFSISNYATTHTADSVYIIGGAINWEGSLTSTIAEYKNDIWTIAGNMNVARCGHGAIAVNGLVMIIGGKNDRLST